eukprot:CAMPEP_0182549624 /NCGR_PEP_ID=MMETSP1323-20130603/40444_1 /TAXON_ID=236787 /ORGANISM="Florenciella parvula, Strain RCC1693" /LENGTH=131 /DNA_ID=CAMNT_0024761101 /DNA_START=77 /DNA_END=469 /DNA_ORIENTATION=-
MASTDRPTDDEKARPRASLPTGRELGAPGQLQLLSIEPELEPEGVDPVQVVFQQPLVAREAQPLVQPQRALVSHLGLEHDLVAVQLTHPFDGKLHQLRADPRLPTLFVHRQHRDVAAIHVVALHRRLFFGL